MRYVGFTILTNMTEEFLLEEFLEKEKELGLNDVQYMQMPLWRLFRVSYREKYIKKYLVDYSAQSAQRETLIWLAYNAMYFISSAFQLVKSLIAKKHYNNIVFAFPRLQKLNENLYIDKFTDPVIDATHIKESVCVFQFINRKIYKGKRWKEDRVIRMEFIVFFSAFVALLLWPIIAFSARKEIKRLYDKVCCIFHLGTIEYVRWCIKFSFFKCEVGLYCFLFKKMRCQNVYVVNRMVCLPQIIAAHQCGLMVLEFQHGITMGVTTLYAGQYDAVADPDYFLVFSEFWRGNQFAIPQDRITNIGWAYKNIINKLPMKEVVHENTCLVISSPEISSKLVETVLLLAHEYSQFRFHIRCHPQESISINILKKIKRVSNVEIVDNNVDSFMALKRYLYVVGVNSSVLFEALSMGKIVARLNFNGFCPIPTHIEEDGFYYVSCLVDFQKFINSKNNGSPSGFYNDFNPNFINSIC